MTAKVEEKTPSGRLPIDASGTVRAIELGTFGSLVGGGLGVAAVSVTPAIVAVALPVVGGLGMAAVGYWRGRDKRPAASLSGN